MGHTDASAISRAKANQEHINGVVLVMCQEVHRRSRESVLFIIFELILSASSKNVNVFKSLDLLNQNRQKKLIHLSSCRHLLKPQGPKEGSLQEMNLLRTISNFLPRGT